MATNTPLTITNEADFFKFRYAKKSLATIYKDFPYWMAINKDQSFGGKELETKVELDHGGSTGFGTLPTAQPVTVDEANLTHKRLFARLMVDGLAWEASLDDADAMEEVSKFEVKRKTISFKKTLEEHLHGDSTGAIGTADGSTPTGSATAPVVIISAATYIKAKWQTKMIVNVGSATDNYMITAVNDSTRAITLSRLDGSVDLTSGALSSILYLQGSKDVAFTGTRGVLSATSGSVYGIPVGKNWQASQLDASNAALTSEFLQQVVLDLYDVCGETPTMIELPVTQYKKLLSQASDLQRFEMSAKSPFSRTDGEVQKSMKWLATLSFQGIGLATDRGVIPVIVNRFLKASECNLLNTDYITFHSTRAGIHFKEKDGTVFMRREDSDEYEGRLALYGDQLIVPTYQGYIYNLAT